MKYPSPFTCKAMALCLSLISNGSLSDAFEVPGWSRGTSKPYQLARDISNANLPSLSHTSTGNTHIHTGRIRHLRPSTLLLYKHTSGYGMPTPPLSKSSDPYAILGLVRHANGISKSDIKSAYRRAALLYHPDVRTDITSKEEKDGANDDFARINAAYAYLIEELENKHKKEKERMNKTPARRTNTNMNVHGAYSRSYADRHIQRNEKAQAQERQKRTSAASASYWSKQGYDGYGGNRHKTTTRNPEAEKAAQSSSSSSQKPKAEELKTKKQRRATYSGSYHHHYGAANGTDTSAGYNQNKSYVGAGIKRNGSGSSSNYSHSYAKTKNRTAASTTAAKYTRTSGANGSYWVRHGPNGPGPGSVSGVNAAAAHGHSFGGRSPTPPRKQTASVASAAAKAAAKKAVPYASVKNSYKAQYSRVTQSTTAPKISHKMPAGGSSSTSIPISPTPKKRSNKPSVSQGHTDSRIPFYAQSAVAKKETGAESTSIPNASTPKTSTEKTKTPYTRIYDKSVNGSRTASSTLKKDKEKNSKPNDSPKIWGDFSNSERFHQQFNSFPQVRQPSNTMNQAYSQPTTNSTKVSYPTYTYNNGKYNYEGVVTLTEGAVDVTSMNAKSSGGLDRSVTTANTNGGKSKKWGDFSDSRSFHERFNPSASAQSLPVSPVSNATDYYQNPPSQAPSVPVASEYVPPVPAASAHTTDPPAQSPTVPTASEYTTNHHAQSLPVPETPAGHHQHSPAQSSPAPVSNAYAHHQKPPTQSPQAPVSNTAAFHQTHSTLTSSTSSSTVTATTSTLSTDSTENLQSYQTQKAEKDNMNEAKKKGNKWADFFGKFTK